MFIQEGKKTTESSKGSRGSWRFHISRIPERNVAAQAAGEILGLRIFSVGIFQAERKILPLMLFSEWWVGVQGAAAPKLCQGFFLHLAKMLEENWSHPLKTGNQQEPARGEFKPGHSGEVQGECISKY